MEQHLDYVLRYSTNCSWLLNPDINSPL